ncbi:hypothetical protein [Pedobacter zeae]|uniref:Uncharacterized protein n=1 Tax=Pedobacter zeae TaxID=1737356 RepID=A0A7W6P766_9SPHI|nr:hypothetical protein [Pedobacter zeae]MBB4110449.1 hypothetical protein [Pedobacter zeae]GGH17957.1 hypothetical protein GCM10007422_41840 [Pedobacter zeae]
MEIKIATNIDTDIFYASINFLKESSWRLTAEYDEKLFDKGIDFDFYRFEKDAEIILLAWNNWFEGEIKATTEILDEIAEQFNFTLEYGIPEYLHDQNLINAMKGLIKIKKGTNRFRV